MSDEIIDVACCVFPDGATFWCEDRKAVGIAVEAWRGTESAKGIPEGCFGGVLWVRMPRSEYIAIGANFPNPLAEAVMNAGL